MKVNVKRAQYNATLNQVNRQEERAVDFSIALGCQFCRNLRGFGKGRLNRLVRGTYGIMADSFDKYRSSDDGPFARDTVPSLYVGLRNQVEALEVNVDGIERNIFIVRGYAGWLPSDRKKKNEIRFRLLTDREKMFRSFWYAMMLCLYDTFGWGKDRLTRFYEYVRKEYVDVFKYYLLCTPAYDEHVERTVKEKTDAISSLGVSFSSSED